MSEKTTLWRCKCCDWDGTLGDLLTAPSPFRPDDTLTACPACKVHDELVNMCDESGCRRDATCGFPTDTAYRRTCGKHWAFAEAQGVTK